MVEDGTIRLSNGDVFTSPSSAALAVNGGISVNGWRVWKMDGEMIADIIDRRR